MVDRAPPKAAYTFGGGTMTTFASRNSMRRARRSGNHASENRG